MIHSNLLRKKPKTLTKTASINFNFLDLPLISTTTGLPLDSVRLQPDRPYTIGRTNLSCDFTFNNRLVSKQHCQILFDSGNRKIYIIDGAFVFPKFGCDYVDEFRRRLLDYNEMERETEIEECSNVKVSLNGVFVNGVRIQRGGVRELFVGDEVTLVCGNEGACGLITHIGFFIRRIVFEEEVAFGSNDICFVRPRLLGGMTLSGHSQGTTSSGNRNKRVFACQVRDKLPSGRDVMGRAEFLSNWCRDILCNDDPITYIRQCAIADHGMEGRFYCSHRINEFLCSTLNNMGKFPMICDRKEGRVMPVSGHKPLLCERSAKMTESHSQSLKSEKVVTFEVNKEDRAVCAHNDHLHRNDIVKVPIDYNHANDNSLSSDYMAKTSTPHSSGSTQNKIGSNPCLPPGKKFYLNRLEFMDRCALVQHTDVSLPELLHPLESILRIFIATFTSDILWFISHCEIPCHLPVTIACHNTERCWSLSPDKRTYAPYPDFPKLVVVYPPFPEAIAFGKDRKKQGIACHHPKLIIVQREDSIRVIITSANLVPTQWNGVTNTIWWQDFPRQSVADYLSLFVQTCEGEISLDSRSDFAAQLAGFVSSLLIDVPSQAHWIIELAKYDFRGAVGHLVASIPGIHSYRATSVMADQLASRLYHVMFLGSVEASVVGLSHIFHKTDLNGAQLKRLAAFLRKSHKNAFGMSEVILRRDSNVPVDANAVSVLVPNPDEFPEEDVVQLGFLPRKTAKWLSPLWDIGFFKFSGYVCPQEALAAALGENNKKLKLILHVFQGPNFPGISKMMQPEHAISLCSLIASIQRCTGLWRLQEVLGQYKWPEHQESEFIYGSSSIGSSVSAQFLAAFSAAAGKRSLQFCDSEESDPEWGCWSASQELKSPSIRIIFPTIERVKNASHGIVPSKRILCFSEKTWQRLRTVDILCDAIPYPNNRIGHPMHVKVARRCFQSRIDAAPFGWVYCGSHNFSAAAWGRPISSPSGAKAGDPEKNSLGQRLHICNYELGIIFIFPPLDSVDSTSESGTNLDDVVLPFVVPAPKYGPVDIPATKWAMREALAELAKQERDRVVELATTDEIMDDIPDEEEDVIEITDYVAEEKEEEKAYAEMLWSQVDSSQTC